MNQIRGVSALILATSFSRFPRTASSAATHVFCSPLPLPFILMYYSVIRAGAFDTCIPARTCFHFPPHHPRSPGSNSISCALSESRPVTRSLQHNAISISRFVSRSFTCCFGPSRFYQLAVTRRITRLTTHSSLFSTSGYSL